MPDQIQSYKVISGGGLNTNQNFLELADNIPGAATRLVNFESSLSGGYRRINGFRALNPTYAEVTSASVIGEGAIFGVFGFQNSATGNFMYLAARKTSGSNVYRFYSLTGSGWTALTTGTTQSSLGVTIVRADVFHDGDTNHIIFVDGVNKALVYNGTTWYQLDSANGGGSGDPGGDQVIDAPSMVSVIKGYVFLGGDATEPGILSYSAPNDPLTWTAAGGGGQQIANFPVVAIKPFRDELFVFGANAIKKSIPDAAASWVFQDVTNNLGCIATDSVFELAGNLVYLSNDGLRVVAGTARIGDVELSTISNSIRNNLFDVASTFSMSRLRSVVIRQKSQFRYFFSDPSITVADSTGLIGSLQVRSNVAWEFGELLGIRTSCTWSGVSGISEEIILHGDYDGRVYRQELGNSFNEANISSIYTTPYFDMGDTEIRKMLRKINTFTRAEGSFDLAIGLIFDWESEDVINPANYLEGSSSSAAIYDAGFKYDAAGTVYGGATQPIMHTNIQGSCFAVKFSFVSDGVYSPYTIQGFVLEYSIKGRQ